MRISAGGRLDGVEAGRGIAAAAVVLYHAARHLNKAYGLPLLMGAFQFGHAGVDFFFVISGFIILFVHYRDIGTPARLGHYAGRRFTRVMPTYWIALALTIAMTAAGGRYGFPRSHELLWSALLLPSWTEPLLGVAWTLQYEIVFYAVFAILIVSRTAGLLALSLWLAWIVIGLTLRVSFNIPPSLYGIYNLEFFFGMAVAYWLANHRVGRPRWVLLAGLASFALACAAENAQLLDGYSGWARLAYGLPGALILLGIVEAERQHLLVVPRALRILGSASYSVYLFQFIFIGIVWKAWLMFGLDRQLPYAAAFIVLAFGGVAGGILTSRWVEYPLMRWIRGGSGHARGAERAQIERDLVRQTTN